MTEHLISESYFQVGNTTLIQRIGIPMGIDPAPYWANLYLHRLELKYIENLWQGIFIAAVIVHVCMFYADVLGNKQSNETN